MALASGYRPLSQQLHALARAGRLSTAEAARILS
jgi:hypothetical protein